MHRHLNLQRRSPARSLVCAIDGLPLILATQAGSHQVLYGHRSSATPFYLPTSDTSLFTTRPPALHHVDDTLYFNFILNGICRHHELSTTRCLPRLSATLCSLSCGYPPGACGLDLLASSQLLLNIRSGSATSTTAIISAINTIRSLITFTRIGRRSEAVFAFDLESVRHGRW